MRLRSSAVRWMPPPLRLLQYIVGLAVCASAVWLSIQVGAGLSPWDVLHAGITVRLGLSFGTVLVGVGVVVLALSWSLGERPGPATFVNVVAVGVALDALLATPWLDGLAQAPEVVRAAVLLVAVVLLGVGSALYIGAGFGAGPRDSLMVACHHRGLPIGPSRCAIELTVVAGGWLLGGPVGLGTLALALGTGPVVQLAFRLLRQQPPAATSRRREDPSTGKPEPVAGDARGG